LRRWALPDHFVWTVWTKRVSKRGADQRDCSDEITEHELGADAHHAITQTAKLAVTARVSAPLAAVIAAVNFNDEPDGGSDEVSDEATTERHLAAKRDAELTRLERGPKPRFGRREPSAVLTSEELETSLRF
jgi:hypothetical protein